MNQINNNALARNEPATQRALRQLLQGVVVPEGTLSNHVPSDLINLIVNEVGHRNTLPRELMLIARQKRIFREGHSLKWLNAQTDERCDLRYIHESWWRQLQRKLDRINKHFTYAAYVQVYKTPKNCYINRSATNAEFNQQCTNQEANNDLQFQYKLIQPKAFTDAAMHYNRMQITITTSVNRNDPDFWFILWSNPEFYNVIAHIPEEMRVSSKGFGITYDLYHSFFTLTIIAYAPRFVASVANETPFDATAWLRQSIANNSDHFELDGVDETIRQIIKECPSQCMFPEHRLSPSLLDDQSRLYWWTQLRDCLFDWVTEHDASYTLYQYAWRTESRLVRQDNSAANIIQASRDALLHYSKFPHIFKSVLYSQGPIDTKGIEERFRLRQFPFPSKPWTVLHIELDLNMPADATDEMKLSHPIIKNLCTVFMQILDLPDRQLSVIVDKHVHFMMYSPVFLEQEQMAANQMRQDTTVSILERLRRDRLRRSRSPSQSSNSSSNSSVGSGDGAQIFEFSDGEDNFVDDDDDDMDEGM